MGCSDNYITLFSWKGNFTSWFLLIFFSVSITQLIAELLQLTSEIVVWKFLNKNKFFLENRSEMEKSLECEVCQKSFKTKSYLKKHIASAHEGKKPFKCNLCDARFTTLPRTNVLCMKNAGTQWTMDFS